LIFFSFLFFNLLQAFSKEGLEEELQASLLHVLREVFPLFRKWRYTDLTQRKLIGLPTARETETEL
jgi:hypothetical protein